MTTDYKPFLVRKMKDNSPVRDSTEWGIMVKHVPFKVYPDMKQLASYDWKDQSGIEEFLSDNPTFKDYDMECEFVFIGEHGTANTQIKGFIDYLAKDGYFSLYDTFTKIGRTKVRYVNNSPDMLHRRDNTTDKVIFKLTLKVTDPVTEIILSK